MDDEGNVPMMAGDVPVDEGWRNPLEDDLQTWPNFEPMNDSPGDLNELDLTESPSDFTWFLPSKGTKLDPDAANAELGRSGLAQKCYSWSIWLGTTALDDDWDR